jgi:hypothetical protein
MSGYIPPSKEFYAIRREVLRLGWGFLNTHGLLSWMAYGFDYPTAVREFREFLGREEQGELPPVDELPDELSGELPPVDENLWREIIHPYAHNPAGMIPVWYIKQEEALGAALELLELLEDADVRMPEIDAIQALTAARDEYLAVYEPFKPLWALAKSWGVDVGQIEEVVRQGRVGRPELYDLEEFINLFKQVLTALKRRHPHVTQKMVAEKLFPVNSPSRYYYRDMLRSYLGRLAKAGYPVSDFRSLVDYIDNPPSLYPLIPTNDSGQ